MILPGHVIEEYVTQGMISVEPRFDARQLRPFGLRVHLAPILLIPETGQRIDLSESGATRPRYREERIGEDPFLLVPGGFVLASTIEVFRLHPSLMCRLDGRSTLARLGLMSHCCATVVDGNHHDHRSIVLELVNAGPFEILLPAGIGIGMATFERVAGEAESQFHQDQYEGQRIAVPPNLDFKVPGYTGFDEP